MFSVNKLNLTNTKQVYGQIVIGPPGSGKTTYCHQIEKFYKSLDRPVTIVNLDPANEQMQYETVIDIMNLITVQDVMDQMKLGPNGALMYCMEFLAENVDWLLEQLNSSPTNYFIFDCPGQVELYTHNQVMTYIFNKLENIGFHLCTVHLIDSHYCSEPSKFISTLMLSLITMLQMGLPHVNVLSKADLFKHFSNKLQFNLDFYTEVLDLNYLLRALDSTPGMAKYTKLNEKIVSIIEDYGLVSFQPLDINNQQSLLRLKNAIDKANGFIYGASEEKSINSLLACAVGAETQTGKMEKDINPYLN